MFPLWECERGRFMLSDSNRSPITIAEFVEGIGKFSRLTEAELAELQRAADERWELVKKLCG